MPFFWMSAVVTQDSKMNQRAVTAPVGKPNPTPTRSHQVIWFGVWIHTFKTRDTKPTKPPLQRHRLLWPTTMLRGASSRASIGYPWAALAHSASLQGRGNAAARDVLGTDAYLLTALCRQGGKQSPPSLVFLSLQSHAITTWNNGGVHQCMLLP